VQKENLTIVVFPGNTEKPRKFHISKILARALLSLILAVILGIGGSSYYFSSDYLRLRTETAELTELRREARLQKIQVERFSQQVKNFETEMSRLAQFEKKLRIITAMENSSRTKDENWGVGGPYGLTAHSFTTSLGKETTALVDRLSEDLGMLNKQVRLQKVSFQELEGHMRDQVSLLSSIPTIWPTRGWVTSDFGYRKSPFTGLRENHEGLDIAARLGSEVRTPADGIVILSGKESGYGNLVEIDHGYGYVTRYGHNSRHLVKAGDKVKRGQTIALVGNTGRSTGPHLHYEVIFNGVPRNPRNYILEN
tara:strand:- start:2560 stop:3489 length:930 start_codon:yes stop_codon:yes gene_type:complete